MKLFSKESHYIKAPFVLVVAYVTFMHYFFPHEWADAPLAQALVNEVAGLVPALSLLKTYAPVYTPYWGVFYAGFWLMIPFFVVLAFCSTFYWSAERYEQLKQITFKGLAWRFPFSLALFLVAFLAPMVSGNAFAFPNQISSFFLILLMSWCSTTVFPVLAGFGIGTCYQRLRFDFD